MCSYVMISLHFHFTCAFCRVSPRTILNCNSSCLKYFCSTFAFTRPMSDRCQLLQYVWLERQSRSPYYCQQDLHKYTNQSFWVCFFLWLLLQNFSKWPMIKKNQSAEGIRKPNDCNVSYRYNHQFVIGFRRKIGYLVIDSAAPNNDAESITDCGRICSHCC